MFRKNKSKDVEIVESKPKKSKEHKISLLSKTTVSKCVKLLLWIAFAFVFIRGTFTLVRADPVKDMQNQEKIFKKQISETNVLENRAFSFAQNFAKDYMTHIPKDEESYKSRLSKYMTSNLMNNIKFNDNDYTIVLYSEAYDIKQYSEKQFDVYVYLRVQYRTPKTTLQLDASQYAISEDDMYLDVPIAYTDDFVVEDMPVVVAGPGKGYVDTKYYNGDSADMEISKNVEKDLNQFFKAYYEQNQTQIDYFLSLDEGYTVKALNGRYTFDKIDKIATYNTNSKNVYLAIVEFKVKDVNGTELVQKFNVKLTMKNDKYYINQLNTRSINISK
ncbi:conjugal transfer protein [Clostridium saccharoperbutylacetonicum]|uniref:conjugal transfer protein n=1 Tax=Clostridium saccharoperbutylacetonicum TaxID=36745 RepID=UPI0039EA4AF8